MAIGNFTKLAGPALAGAMLVTPGLAEEAPKVPLIEEPPAAEMVIPGAGDAYAKAQAGAAVVGEQVAEATKVNFTFPNAESLVSHYVDNGLLNSGRKEQYVRSAADYGIPESSNFLGFIKKNVDAGVISLPEARENYVDQSDWGQVVDRIRANRA